MKEHGSYKIELFKRVIIVRFFDTWNKETSLKMCGEFQKKAKILTGSPWACIVDLTNWDLGGPEVWEPIIQVNDWCTENGQELEAVICITELQKYILEKTQTALPKTESAFFNTEIEAKKWLEKYGYDTGYDS
jgi:hypothetical protein